MLTFLFGPKLTRYKKFLTPFKQIISDNDGNIFAITVVKMHAVTYRPRARRFQSTVSGFYLEEVNGVRVGKFLTGDDSAKAVQVYLEEQPSNRFVVARQSNATDPVSAH